MATGSARKKSSSSGRRTASTKKRSTSSSRGSSKRGSSKNKQVINEVFDEIYLIVAIAVCVLLFLSVLGFIGSVGNVIADIMFGIFGLVSYVLPIVLLVGVAFYLSNKGLMVTTVKITSAIVLMVAICAFCQLLFFKDGVVVDSVLDYYINCSESKMGGGIVGGSVVRLLIKIVGSIGTYIVLAVVSLICIMLITERSIIESGRNIGSNVKENVRDNIERHRENQPYREEQRELNQRERELRRQENEIKRLEREEQRNKEREENRIKRQIIEENRLNKKREAIERREEETRLRMEKKVSGVMLDTKLVKQPGKAMEDDIHEIVAEGMSEQMDSFDNNSFKNSHTITVDTSFAELHNDSYLQNSDFNELNSYAEDHSLDNDYSGYGNNDYVNNNNSGYGNNDYVNNNYSEPDNNRDDYCYNNHSHNINIDKNNYDDNGYSDNRYNDNNYNDNGYSDNGYNDNSYGYDNYEDDDSTEDYSNAIISETESLSHLNDYDEYVKPQAVAKETRSHTAPATQATTDNSAGANKQNNSAKVNKKKNLHYRRPPINLLKPGDRNARGESKEKLNETSMLLQQTLKEFGVNVTMTGYSQGPAITRFEMRPERGLSVKKVLNLQEDIKLSMAATDVRIEAPIPGKSAIGIEIPNKENTTVMFRELIESQEFKNASSNISFAVGKGLSGETVVADIAKMPHLLIAGATGSGKSVCINTLIMSILYKAHPNDVKLIMVDPKVVELSVYNGIPHLLIPVVTDPKHASEALKWGVVEMDDRYEKFAQYGVRDLKGYNQKIKTLTDIPEDERPEPMYQLVIIVDELADLMMVASKEVEESICRIAQKARAAGIHLVIATQRPSVDVITGLIKANMPSRIAFSVSSGTDSRTILDMTGAERLLGKGDMLFYPAGSPKPSRVQGAFISDDEVNDVVEFLKKNCDEDVYDTSLSDRVKSGSASGGDSAASGGDDRDELFDKAARLIIDKNKASIGMLQRMFKIGFNRAARIMDQLAEAGIVGEEEGTKPRKILMSEEQYEQFVEDYL